MDELLEAAVLAGLLTLKNADLPIQTGDFYTKHMIPAKPEGAVACKMGCWLGAQRNGQSYA
jgi:hypothetical protein